MTITTDEAREGILAAFAAIPPGHWTTYGDISEVVYGHRMAGNAVAKALTAVGHRTPGVCRVRLDDGSVYAGNVPGRSEERRHVVEAMWNVRAQAEGMGIRPDGTAHPADRLSIDALRALTAHAVAVEAA